MSLMKLIENYDLKTQKYIERLEKENEELRNKLSDMTNLVVKGEALREKMFLEAIIGGTYDKASKAQ